MPATFSGSIEALVQLSNALWFSARRRFLRTSF
jgi:hypothetical protein